MKNRFNVSTDDVLCRLGLERRRSRLARTVPWLAGLGLGALAGIGLLTAARTERGQKLRKNVSQRLSRNGKKKDELVHTPASAASARDAVHANA